MTHPIEVIKFCPKCGSGNFLSVSERSFRCSDCAFHFFINSSTAVAAIIVNNNGELLLTQRAVEPHKGMLDLPGGFVDPGESAEDALIREVSEELNLKVDDLQYLVSYPNEYVFSKFSVFTTDLGFLCTVKDFTSITYRDGISGYLFVKPEEIIYSKISSESICRIIKFFIENQKIK